MGDGAELAKRQLLEIVEASRGAIEFCSESKAASGSAVTFEITLPFQGAKRVPNGLPIHARERFFVHVSTGFPFSRPSVSVRHRRFAGFPHVQFARHPCLYQSDSEWSAEEGMYGFIRRLDGWVRDAALGKLDPDEAPLHPPVAYPTADRLVVPIADAPTPVGQPWFGYAVLRERGSRTEIVDWLPLTEDRPELFAPAIILHEPLPFEFPTTIRDLSTELEGHGVEYAPFIWLLARLALDTPAGTPLLVVLGTPMRRVEAHGPLLTHLAALEIDAEAADSVRALNALDLGEDSKFHAMGQTALKKVAEWSVGAKVGWCEVREARPAVTRRRDEGSPANWFANKTVEIWGCGAIGSHVAESVVRAGIRKLILIDNQRVVPGILVRQAFDDDDIGRRKAEALGDRVRRIAPDLEVEVEVKNLLTRLDEQVSHAGVDVVLDCTASATVRAKLEKVLRDCGDRPPIGAMAVSYDAGAAIATLSPSGWSGGTADLMRRLKLDACRGTLGDLVEAFWPSEPRTNRFQPEPGCSEPTFVGSDADLAAFSARMLNALASELCAGSECESGCGWLLEGAGALQTFRWRPDVVVGTPGGRYEVRVSPTAIREMRAWARTSRRRYGRKPETGGLIFGEVNEAAGVVWVSEVEGPPPDSAASETHFTCGVAGMADANAEKQRRFRKAVVCLGSWHTHPSSPARPSDVDVEAVFQILGGSERKTCVLLIMAGDPDTATLGAHIFRTIRRGDAYLNVEFAAEAVVRVPQEPPRARDVGLALSGGGARAMAFHLGCLRALHDCRLLDRLQVISSVSGGSVIGAMYTYSSDAFPDFDAKVVQVLRRGLVQDIARSWIRPRSLLLTAFSLGTTVPAAVVRTAAKLLPAGFRKRLPLIGEALPPRRLYSRTEAFRDALQQRLFGKRRVVAVEREGLDIVINATELRTGSAFRFGSRESGCWRFGTLPESPFVADAVAASAAYPALLPALDRRYSFKRREVVKDARVVLTDGGVFENLGVSPMEPGRDPTISTNAFNPAFIISCDAGAGLLSDESLPMWWPGRMQRSFIATFRKVQDATRKRLHQLASSGEISGFVLSYLGQNDGTLPWIPADLPRRDDVKDYPTDFFAMDDEDIEKLSLRGELLTRLLVAYYLPDP